MQQLQFGFMPTPPHPDEKIYSFDLFDTQALAKNQKARHQFHLKNGYRCFYTGIICKPYIRHKKLQPNPFEATLEHLVPKASAKGTISLKDPKAKSDMYKSKMPENLVTCSFLMNWIVGAAPLSVKYALREHFKTIVVHPALSTSETEKVILYAAKGFLSKYKVSKKKYAWDWKSYSETAAPEQREKARLIYMDLLMPEEIQAGLYLSD